MSEHHNHNHNHHKHHHKHDEAVEQLEPQGIEQLPIEEFDPGAKSLSEALRISFIILKVIMVVLVILFLAWGFRMVGPDEQALVLQFGKIQGAGEKRLLGPGPHWVFPYPIEEIVKINVEKKPNLPINSFWYYQRPDQPPDQPSRVEPTLNPLKDGYCITRSEKQLQLTGSQGSDYNIIHSKWQLTYKIDDPERFFKNVYVESIKPGQVYFDVISESLTPVLRNLVEDSIVSAMVNYTIDEAISSQDRIPKHVAKLLQDKLDKIQSGIKVVSIQLTDVTWPRQVDYAFLASIKASQDSQKTISEARTYAENAMNQAAGPVASELLAAIENTNTSEQQKELLWEQAAGASQEKIAQARAYRTKVVETTKANADYLQQLLPQYRQRPQLVIQKIYQDAIEYVLGNINEKIIIQPTEGTKGSEIRVMLNRDPTIKPKPVKGK
jgi:membrane protease subunit HflK